MRRVLSIVAMMAAFALMVGLGVSALAQSSDPSPASIPVGTSGEDASEGTDDADEDTDNADDANPVTGDDDAEDAANGAD